MPEYVNAGVNVIVLSPLTTAVPSDAFGNMLMVTINPPSSKPVSLSRTYTVIAVSYSVPSSSSVATGI